MKTVFVLTTISLLSTGLLAGNWFTVQEPAQAAGVLSGFYSVQAAEPAQQTYLHFGLGEQPNESQDAVNTALNALKSAEDDAAKRTAESDLRKALEADYDARLEGYEKHLDQLETELAKMRDQLQKRKMAKSEMVALRMQVLQAEADDLGWPSPVGSRGGNSFFRSTTATSGAWASEIVPPAMYPYTTGAAPLAPKTPVAPTAPAASAGPRTGDR